MARFKFLPISMGSGWTSGHVAVDEYHSFPSTRDENGKPLHICLTQDAQNFEEFSPEIDILIKELEAVRATGKRKFSKQLGGGGEY